MLPPLTSSLASTKPNSTQDATALPQPNNRGALASKSTETGPARIRPETTGAVDPAHASAQGERLRAFSPEGQRRRDLLPAGPPPAFVETLLERQAREAFAPNRGTSITGSPPTDPTLRAPQDTAVTSFNDAREAIATPSRTDVDQRA